MSDPPPPRGRHVIPLREAVAAWFAISWQTFGGPAGQIAVMHRELVERRRWIGERRFLHAMSYCMLLPGPEAQQLAIYAGWLLNGWVGGVVAGVLFVVPGLLTILALSWVYVAHGDSTIVTGVLLGLSAAVLPVVVQAVLRIAGRVSRAGLVLAVVAFVAIAVLAVPFPLVVLGAAVVGWWVGRRRPELIARPAEEAADGPTPLIPDDALHRAPRSWRRSTAVAAVGLALWVAPVAVAATVAGGAPSVFVDQGVFFGGMALVTFGGAYAVLAYVAQAAVGHYGWLTAQEMVRGLALAETTPGPLIMVVQFVAFLGAFRHPSGLDPWMAAVVASLLVVWVTFVPGFLFVFVGAPYVERLRDNESIAAALAGVTAAVVGVIVNLALYFAVHTLFADTARAGWEHLGLVVPEWSTFLWRPAVLGVLAGVLVFRLRWSVLRTLGVCAVAGLLLTLAS